MHTVIYLLDLRTILIFKRNSCDGRLPHMKIMKSYLSHDRPAKRYWVHIQSFSFSIVAIDMHGKLACRALSIGKNFAQVLISNCNVRITLMLHRYDYVRLHVFLKESIWSQTALSCLCSKSKEVVIAT